MRHTAVDSSYRLWRRTVGIIKVVQLPLVGCLIAVLREFVYITEFGD